MIQNILLALFFLISLVLLDGCATFKHNFSIGVNACSLLCKQNPEKACSTQSENTDVFTCNKSDGSLVD